MLHEGEGGGARIIYLSDIVTSDIVTISYCDIFYHSLCHNDQRSRYFSQCLVSKYPIGTVVGVVMMGHSRV